MATAKKKPKRFYVLWGLVVDRKTGLPVCTTNLGLAEYAKAKGRIRSWSGRIARALNAEIER